MHMEPEVTETSKRQGGFAESFGDLEVYKLAFALQQDIFNASRTWPREEAYSLTDQVRRSSRSVGACIAEAWGKRKYEAHFFSKLTDADSELNETLHWLRTAYTCQYIPLEVCEPLAARIKSIAKMLNRMMASASSFCLPNPYRP